jgi:hypothetical protein
LKKLDDGPVCARLLEPGWLIEVEAVAAAA